MPSLEARRDNCDAMVCGMSAGEVIRLTRLGSFRMNAAERGVISLLKRLRGGGTRKQSSGARQMTMLRRIPKILRFIPGAAQDVRAYFLTLQYLLAGSEDNIANLVRFLVNRYADGPRRRLARQAEGRRSGQLSGGRRLSPRAARPRGGPRRGTAPSRPGP